MKVSSEPLAQLSHLPNADGSASFSFCGYAVTATANGPIEAPRRDENPFEALVDVTVRPAAGVGGTAERQLESILQAALRQLIPVRDFPRCMIQVTLQVTETPVNAYQGTKLVQAQVVRLLLAAIGNVVGVEENLIALVWQNLPLIPALLHAAILGLLAASVPLKKVAVATTLAIPAASDDFIVEPDAEQVGKAKSLHTLSFTSDDELLLAESSGLFSVEEWNKILEAGKRVCCQDEGSGFDTAMGGIDHESTNMKAFIRTVLKTKAAADLHWK